MPYPTKRTPTAYFYAWTDEAVTCLRRLVQEGYSALRITVELGRDFPGKPPSRSAVVGKCHRLGLQLNGNPVRSSSKPRAQRKRPAAPPRKPGAAYQGKASKLAAWISTETLPPAPLPVPEPPPHGSVALVDLTHKSCRWPYGNGPFLFCGCDAMLGRPYCEAHHAKGTEGKPPAKIRAPRDFHNVPVDFRRRQAA